MKYAETKLTPWLLLGLLLALSCYDVARATTTISSGHADIFEVEYEKIGSNAPTLLFGVHSDQHYEPGEVLLEVGNLAFTSTEFLPSVITSLLGANAWILPADPQEAFDMGILEAGVGKVGFPNNNAVTFSLVGAGPNNPGNFVLFTVGNAVRLSATGNTLGSSAFSITAAHIHYNWGFSAPGTYTFDLKASYMDADFGVLESATETYTFNVIPEPTCGTFLLIGLVGWVAARKRVVLKE